MQSRIPNFPLESGWVPNGCKKTTTLHHLCTVSHVPLAGVFALNHVEDSPQPPWQPCLSAWAWASFQLPNGSTPTPRGNFYIWYATRTKGSPSSLHRYTNCSKLQPVLGQIFTCTTGLYGCGSCDDISRNARKGQFQSTAKCSGPRT